MDEGYTYPDAITYYSLSDLAKIFIQPRLPLSAEPVEKPSFSSATFTEKSKDFLVNEPSNFESLDSKFGMLLHSNGKAITVNEPVAGNHDNDNTLDSVFNIDNSWMSKHNNNNNTSDINGKKIKVDANLLGDRVFSLPQFGKKQNHPSEIDMDLRKPLQGREDKTK